MSDRLRSRRAAVLALLACCCWPAGGALAGRSGFSTRPSRRRMWRTFGTARTSATCSTSGRRSRGRGRPVRARWSSSSTAVGFGAATSRACPPGWSSSAWTRGSRSPRRTIGLSQTAAFPAPMLDGARAIQFVRHNAAELGIDPDRIAASGSSAGAGIALWVGFHDDLADPKSTTRVARVRRGCAAWGSTAPRRRTTRVSSKSLIGGRAHEHSALRAVLRHQVRRRDLDSPRIHKLFEEASPINYVTSDDPPVILFYAEPNAPLPADAKPGQGIHHPRFGQALKSKLDPLGIECVLRHWTDYPREDDPIEDMCRDMTGFFVRQFETQAPEVTSLPPLTCQDRVATALGDAGRATRLATSIDQGPDDGRQRRERAELGAGSGTRS